MAIDPRDGQEMRHLPEEQDREEHGYGRVEGIRHGRPADHGRHRTGDRSDQGVEGRRTLQWGVEEHIARKRKRRRHDRQGLTHRKGQVRQTSERQATAEKKDSGWL